MKKLYNFKLVIFLILIFSINSCTDNTPINDTDNAPIDNTHKAVVLSKHFTPASSHIIQGVIVDPSTGNVSVPIGVSSNPDTYTILLQYPNGKVKSHSFKPEIYLTINVGDTMVVETGFWIGTRYIYTIQRISNGD